MSRPKYIVDTSRRLRRRLTPSEKILWTAIRNRKLNNLKFLRQHPFVYGDDGFTKSFFVADFYCDEKKLVVELDGEIHDIKKDYDKNRDKILNELGLSVIRIKNSELANLSEVLKKIAAFQAPSPRSIEGAVQQSADRVELTGIIVLAAGSSSRMGQPKQLLPVDGEPLLLKTVKTALASLAQNIVVVLGANGNELLPVIKHLPVETVYNASWENGMGGSIKSGLNFLLTKAPSIHGVTVLVCDQPLLSAAHIRNLIQKHQQTNKPIIASSYAGTSGVPAYFERSVFKQLLSLHDKQGAKKIIAQSPSLVELVDFPFGEIDLDSRQDYDTFLNNFK